MLAKKTEEADTKLKRVREKIKTLGLTENDIDEAIRWARSR
jgi:hypothetical protein